MRIGTGASGRPWLRSLGLLLLLLLAFILGALIAPDDLPAAVEQLAQRAAAPPAGELPLLRLDVPFANFRQLQTQRERALAQGAILVEEEDFVNATATLAEESVPVRLRLQPGPAHNLGPDEKWPFDLRTRGAGTLLGMARFYLQDPAENNWLAQWGFLETLRREGLLAPQYRFVRLRVNGDEWGIYALQQGFGSDLPAAQGRPPGVLLEFNGDRVWQALAHFEGDEAAAATDPVTNMNAVDWPFGEIDTFQTGTLNADPTLAAQQAEAVNLLRGLQTGRLPAADVFDVERYGRFLALADLWDARQAVALTNLRYFYNPDSGRLEPVAFNGQPLAGDGRVSLNAVYQDSQLQAAYVAAAAEYARPSYLAALRADLEPAWERLARGLGPAVAAGGPWSELTARQAQMRRSLAPVEPLFAYLGEGGEAQLVISVANVLNLPVEIVGIDVAGAAFLPADPAWVTVGETALLARDPLLLAAAGSGREAVLRYLRLELPLTALQDPELPLTEAPELEVITRIWGLARTQRTPVQPPPLAVELMDE